MFWTWIYRVVDMEPLHHVLKVKLQGCQNGTIVFSKWPTKNPGNNGGEKETQKQRWQKVSCCWTAEQKEHRLNKCRTKDRARHAAHAAAEVVLHRYTLLNGVWPIETTACWDTRTEGDQITTEECVYMQHAHALPTPCSYISAKAITNQIDCCSSSFHITACSGLPHNARRSASVYIVLFQGLLQIQCCCYWV